jgi:hypothetical protein
LQVFGGKFPDANALWYVRPPILSMHEIDTDVQLKAAKLTKVGTMKLKRGIFETFLRKLSVFERLIGH